MRKRKNKYGVAAKAARTFDGIVFASKREMKRYRELKLLEQAGEIKNLELQPRYDLIVNGVKCGFWKGDFRYSYRSAAEWGVVVEDAKGFKTPVYRLKKKLVEAIYGFEIIEV